jgi:excisionase family DNA binding protein
MSDSFERSNTTRTKTMSVSDTQILDGFRVAIQTAIEQAETALAYSNAVSDSNIEEAEQLFEQLSAIAMNGLGACTKRRNEILHQADKGDFEIEEMSSGEVVVPSAEFDSEQDEPSPLLLALDDAARFLGVSRDEIVRLMDGGEFEAEFIGAELRLNMRDLDAYLQRNGAGRSPTPHPPCPYNGGRRSRPAGRARRNWAMDSR